MGQSTEPEHPDNSTQVIDPIARLTAPDTLPTAPNARQETRVSNPHVSEFLEGQILATRGDQPIAASSLTLQHSSSSARGMGSVRRR